MRGLKSKDLEAIVDFIYNGEANIYQKDLDGFLALAEELQIKGLAGSANEHPEAVEHQPQKQKKIKRETFDMSNQIAMQNDGLKATKSLLGHEQIISDIMPVKMLLDADTENIKAQMSSMMEKFSDNDNDNKWRCTVCAKVMKLKCDMGRHIETHIDGVSHPCNLCGAVKRSSNALHTHIARYHRN